MRQLPTRDQNEPGSKQVQITIRPSTMNNTLYVYCAIENAGMENFEATEKGKEYNVLYHHKTIKYVKRKTNIDESDKRYLTITGSLLEAASQKMKRGYICFMSAQTSTFHMTKEQYGNKL